MSISLIRCSPWAQVTYPHGKELLTVKRKSQEETYHHSQEAGEYKFCFHNSGPQHAQVSFDLQSYTDWLNRKAEPLKGGKQTPS